MDRTTAPNNSFKPYPFHDAELASVTVGAEASDSWALRIHQLEQFPFVRSVRLQADHHGPAKAGHYVLIESGLVAGRYPTCEVLRDRGRIASA